MSEEGNRNTLHRRSPARHYVEAYPQSSERIRGKRNWRSILQNYPGLTSFDYGFKLGGELGVAELIAEYDGERVYACETVELEDGKVKRVRAYFGEPFEAP